MQSEDIEALNGYRDVGRSLAILILVYGVILLIIIISFPSGVWIGSVIENHGINVFSDSVWAVETNLRAHYKNLPMQYRDLFRKKIIGKNLIFYNVFAGSKHTFWPHVRTASVGRFLRVPTMYILEN